MNTDLYPLTTLDPHFPFSGARLVHTGYRKGSSMHRNIYHIADGVREWDGAEWATHAIGSCHGVYCYVTIKVTGRKATPIGVAGMSGEYGWRCKVTVAAGTPDEESFIGWLVSADGSTDWETPPSI